MELLEIFELAILVGLIAYELKSRSEVAELRGKVESMETPDIPDVTDIKIEQARMALEIKYLREKMKDYE